MGRTTSAGTCRLPLRRRLWRRVAALGRSAVAIPAACLLAASGCGPQQPAGTVEAPVVVTAGQEVPVGSAGGVLLYRAGEREVRLHVPASALSATTPLTIREHTERIPGAVGPVYELGPSGTQFSHPATLTISTGPTDLSDFVLPPQLRVATYRDGSWLPLDTVAKNSPTPSGETAHFSLFALVPTTTTEPSFLFEQEGQEFSVGGVNAQFSTPIRIHSMMVASRGLFMRLSASEAKSVDITLHGLLPSTRVYQFADNPREAVPLFTSADGAVALQYSLVGHRQNLALVPYKQTRYISAAAPAGLDCEKPFNGSPLGTWVSESSTCRLNQDGPTEAIWLIDDNTILDCTDTQQQRHTLHGGLYVGGDTTGAGVMNCDIPAPNTVFISGGANSVQIVDNAIAFPDGAHPFSLSFSTGDGSGHLVTGNTIVGHVQLGAVSDSVISKNTITGGIRIHGYGSRGHRISDNSITAPAGAAIDVGLGYIDVWDVDIAIENNQIVCGDAFVGVQDASEHGIRIAGNAITRCHYGLRLVPSRSWQGRAGMIHNNRLYDNFIAMRVEHGSYRIFLNDIYDNYGWYGFSTQVSYLGLGGPADFWDHEIGPTYHYGNYWGHRCGDPHLFIPNVDGAGAVDQAPYGAPVAAFTDHSVAPPPPGCTIDSDGDGYYSIDDCDDTNPNCTADCTDADSDGYCVTHDCDDARDFINPGHPEQCDGIDNDCDPLTSYMYGERDDDGDGYLTCSDFVDNAGLYLGGDDCDDTPSPPGHGPSVHPGAADHNCDGLDNDCNGITDPDFPVNAECDNGMLGACLRQGRLVCGTDEQSVVCTAPFVDPSEEYCNDTDDDCDGTVDDGVCGNATNADGAPTKFALTILGPDVTGNAYSYSVSTLDSYAPKLLISAVTRYVEVAPFTLYVDGSLAYTTDTAVNGYSFPLEPGLEQLTLTIVSDDADFENTTQVQVVDMLYACTVADPVIVGIPPESIATGAQKTALLSTISAKPTTNRNAAVRVGRRGSHKTSDPRGNGNGSPEKQSDRRDEKARGDPGHGRGEFVVIPVDTANDFAEPWLFVEKAPAHPGTRLTATAEPAGTNIIRSSDLAGDERMTFLAPLDIEGVESILARRHGDPKGSVEISILDMDVTPPVAIITAPVQGFVTRSALVFITGVTYDDSARVFINGIEIPTTPGGSLHFQAPLVLEYGANYAEIEVVDPCGNASKTTIRVFYDCIAPPELLCDGDDEDCDGVIDGPFDVDRDTYTTCGGTTNRRTDGSVGPGDCNDSNRYVYPGAPELCDGADNDCDGTADEGWEQAPHKLGETCNVTLGACEFPGIGLWQCHPLGHATHCVLDSDTEASVLASCDADQDGDLVESDLAAALDPNRYSGAEEICDGIDNDNDDQVDEDTGCEVCP